LVGRLRVLRPSGICANGRHWLEVRLRVYELQPMWRQCDIRAEGLITESFDTEPEWDGRRRAVQILFNGRFLQDTNSCGSNHKHIRRTKQIHTYLPLATCPFRFHVSLNLAHIERKCIVSVTLPTKSRIQPITPCDGHAGLQFLRPPHRLPSVGLRSRVPTESCKASASNRARPRTCFRLLCRAT
jgi:hypothetical protein